MSGKRRISLNQMTTELVVGFVFIVAMGVLAFFTIILSRDALFGKAKIIRLMDFSQTGALKKGDKILLRGVGIGQIGPAEISPDDPNQVRVKLVLDRPVVFGENYVAEIRSSSVLGGEYLYIETGDTAKPVTGVLTGKPPTDVFGEARRLADNLNEVVTEVKHFTEKLKNPDSTIARLVNDDSLYRSAEDAFGSVKKAGDQLKEEIAGARASFDKAATNIDQAATSVRTAADSVAKTSDNLDGAIADARAGQGTVGKLLTDDQLYTDFSAAVAEVRKVATGLSSDESSVGRLMHDNGALYDSVKTAFNSVGTTMGDAAAVVAEVNKGEGTLGKIIYDETLYRDLRQAVRDLSGAISDYREQAPILTFGSFIFGSL